MSLARSSAWSSAWSSVDPVTMGKNSGEDLNGVCKDKGDAAVDSVALDPIQSHDASRAGLVQGVVTSGGNSWSVDSGLSPKLEIAMGCDSGSVEAPDLNPLSALTAGSGAGIIIMTCSGSGDCMRLPDSPASMRMVSRRTRFSQRSASASEHLLRRNWFSLRSFSISAPGLLCLRCNSRPRAGRERGRRKEGTGSLSCGAAPPSPSSNGSGEGVLESA
mmetsp:Transcript_54700/g.123079  ORF Transcript_54700/g.123079 Transcript_54700/m.123079 type:complete len:218 (-) Transcript_54700:746-1399(-)